jgi:hypothetical protein
MADPMTIVFLLPPMDEGAEAGLRTKLMARWSEARIISHAGPDRRGWKRSVSRACQDAHAVIAVEPSFAGEAEPAKLYRLELETLFSTLEPRIRRRSLSCSLEDQDVDGSLGLAAQVLRAGPRGRSIADLMAADALDDVEKALSALGKDQAIPLRRSRPMC